MEHHSESKLGFNRTLDSTFGCVRVISMTHMDDLFCLFASPPRILQRDYGFDAQMRRDTEAYDAFRVDDDHLMKEQRFK